MNETELSTGQQVALQLAELLKSESIKIVLAESCTCGMAAALLGSVPGISNHLCGSCVTYRVSAKTDWLGLDSKQIQRDSAESLETTKQMAIGVLQSTAEATWSAAITGDLGPNAGETDGRIHICVARAETQKSGTRAFNDIEVVQEHSTRLKTGERVPRQLEAATLMLQQLTGAIQNASV